MTIFYTASYPGKGTYQKFYDLVLSTLKETRAKIISPELGNYRHLLSNTESAHLHSDREIHYAAIQKGIQNADAVVIEISHEDFQLGHEATLAIQAKKHVLCLSLHEDFSEKIRHRFFHGAIYNEYTLPEIIDDFVKKTARGIYNERFNFFLSPQQLDYLTIQANKKTVTASEYLRNLIDLDQKHAPKSRP